MQSSTICMLMIVSLLMLTNVKTMITPASSDDDAMQPGVSETHVLSSNSTSNADDTLLISHDLGMETMLSKDIIKAYY